LRSRQGLTTLKPWQGRALARTIRRVLGQWAAKMREIGLQPSSTGEEGGKETGQGVSHFIIPDGRYAKAYAKLAATGFALHWQSVPASAKAKTPSKVKFTCPECGQNAWAKPNAKLFCGGCYEDGQGPLCRLVAGQ